MAKGKIPTLSKIGEKKIEAYDLLRRINGHLATARQLQSQLAKLETEMAELEKSDGGT